MQIYHILETVIDCIINEAEKNSWYLLQLEWMKNGLMDRELKHYFEQNNIQPGAFSFGCLQKMNMIKKMNIQNMLSFWPVTIFDL